MTSCNFGDIVLVPFPFTDQTSQKKRPAVVVNSAAYQRERPDLILMAVTSQVRPSPGFGEKLLAEWREAGLLKPSVLKPILFTLEKGLIVRKLGRLRQRDLDSLKKSLSEVLGLSEG